MMGARVRFADLGFAVAGRGVSGRWMRVGLAMLGLAGVALCGVGAANPAAAAPSAAKCLSSSDFTVIYRESHLGPGSDILARRGGEAPDPCVFAKAPGDFDVGARDDADYVLGLSGRFLVMDRGTGPARKLIIYDLASRKAVLTVPYDTSTPVNVSATAVTFSVITGPASAKSCPKLKEYAKQGLGAALSVGTKVTLPTLARSTSGPTRCVAQQ